MPYHLRKEKRRLSSNTTNRRTSSQPAFLGSLQHGLSFQTRLAQMAQLKQNELDIQKKSDHYHQERRLKLTKRISSVEHRIDDIEKKYSNIKKREPRRQQVLRLKRKAPSNESFTLTGQILTKLEKEKENVLQKITVAIKAKESRLFEMIKDTYSQLEKSALQQVTQASLLDGIEDEKDEEVESYKLNDLQHEASVITNPLRVFADSKDSEFDKRVILRRCDSFIKDYVSSINQVHSKYMLTFSPSTLSLFKNTIMKIYKDTIRELVDIEMEQFKARASEVLGVHYNRINAKAKLLDEDSRNRISEMMNNVSPPITPR
ncbi:hypothetical protein PCE1_004517 [Barthelona sp. PCE]